MIVGLDIGSKLIKVAGLAGSRRWPRVVKFAVREVPEEGGPEAIGTALESLFLEERLPRDRVYSSISGPEAILRDISVPFVQEDQIRRTIKFEAEGAFHGHSIDSLLIDYYKIGTVQEKSRLLVAGVPKRILVGHLSLLAAAKVDPPRVGLDIGALFNTASWCGSVPERGSAVILDVGAVFLRVLVTEDGRLRAARAIRLRAAPLALPAPPKEEEPPAESPSPVAAEPEEMDERIVSRLVTEVSRTILGCRLRGPLESLWITGGGAGRSRLARALEEKLSITAFDMDLPPGSYEGDVPASDLAAGAVGAALAGMGRDPAGFDFRQEEHRYRRTLERIHRGLATAVCAIYIGLFLFTWSTQNKIRDTHSRIQFVVNSETALLGILFPHDDLQGRDSLEVIRRKKGLLQQRYEGRDTEIRSTLRDLRLLSVALSETKAALEFTTIRLRQDTSRLEGEAPSADEVFKFQKHLIAKVQESKGQEMEVSSPAIETKEGGLVTFSIDIKHPKR